MTELEAMAIVSRVLETLPDNTARQRVLRWAAERAGVDVFAAVVPATTSPVSIADDPALKLDSLEDIFGSAPLDEDDLTVDVDVPAPATPDASKVPIADTLRSFAAEFQRFAEEWNGAAA